MVLSNFPNGVSSFGVPVLPSNGGYGTPNSTWWFVNTYAGSDGAEGTSPESAFQTMERAFDMVGSGDVIYFQGNVREQLVSPAGIFGVTIFGGPNHPRYADAHTSNNGYTASTWRQPASGATALTALLRIQQQGWRLSNFLMANAEASSPCVQLYRDGGASDDERDGSQVIIDNMQIVDSAIGININGGLAGVSVLGCNFFNNTTAVSNTVGAGIGTNIYFLFEGNLFRNNTNHVVVPMSRGVIRNNVFGTFTTLGLSLSGGAGDNMVTGNLLSGTYSIAGGYVRAAASDNWAGNLTPDTGVTTVLTQSDPA